MPEIPDALEAIVARCTEVVRKVDPKVRMDLMRSIMDSRKVFVYGSGRSGLIGQLFAVRLVQLGYDVHFVGEMTTPIIGPKDLTILISNTGRTSSVVQTAVIARRIGSHVVCLTGNADSELAHNSDATILLDIPDDPAMSNVAPLGTVFEDSAHLFFESLIPDLMEMENATEEEMRNRHAIWV